MSLWIDVTGMVRGSGHFSGVPRVRTTLILKWLGTSEIDVRYFDYDGASAAFREVPGEFIRALLARTGTGSREKNQPPAQTTLSRLNQRIAHWLDRRLFFLSGDARRAAMDFFQAGV